MRKVIIFAGTSLGLLASPSYACDLDGMFGLHRFNAFANLSGHSFPSPEPQPETNSQQQEPERGNSDESADPAKQPSTVATLSEQADQEPTDPPATEKFDPRKPNSVPKDEADPQPSAMFR